MKRKYNKYEIPTKEERIDLLKESIKKLEKTKKYKFIVESYKKQLKKLLKKWKDKNLKNILGFVRDV